MENESDFENKIYFLQGSYLGRTPRDRTDSEQTLAGNGLALIEAFVMFQNKGGVPEPWIMDSLGSMFIDYLNRNRNATGHKDYTPLDVCFRVSRKTFRAMGTETKYKEIAERFFLFRWAFVGLSNKQIFEALRISGYKIEVTGKEKEDPERVFERTTYAQMYGTFEKIVERRFDKEATVQQLLEELPKEARDYIKKCLRRLNS